jgi:tRNA threonylcarbamoyladenosine biosynthesis protein TsaB
MLLLALDTSTRQASVALCDEQRLYGEYTWQVGNNHSVELLERIQRLFAECGMTLSALDGLAVANGPGSFNGVRVAVATARTLAFALRKPLVGISSLEVCATQFRYWPGPICSVLEAGRSELYAACYQFSGQESVEDLFVEAQRLGDYQVLSPADLVRSLQTQVSPDLTTAEAKQPAYLICGEISEASRQALVQNRTGPLVFAPVHQSARHASTLASLAFRRFMEKRLDDPLLLEPLYVRRPSITTSGRKQPLLGNKSDQTSQQNELHSTERGEGALRH